MQDAPELSRTTQTLLGDPAVAADPVAVELAHVLGRPTGLSSGGHPFLEDAAYVRFRDRVPHILAMGPPALAALDSVVAAARATGVDVLDAARVVRGCVLTAAITAPSDLWLLRHVVGALRSVGVVDRLLHGEAIDPARCDVQHQGAQVSADPRELEADLVLLLSRGLVDSTIHGLFVVPSHPRARRALERTGPRPPWSSGISRAWRDAFLGKELAPDERAALVELGNAAPRRGRGVEGEPATWVPSAEEIEGGARLLPVVLGLRAAGHHERLARGAVLSAADTAPHDPDVGAAALRILEATGVVVPCPDGVVATDTGRRVAEKGAGPMGIIEAYHPYMDKLEDILMRGRQDVWLTRSANITASQDANKESFTRANASLDAFCADTGFGYGVFIEHAIGRGEATRQRFATARGTLRYVGADLEDAAIDACAQEAARGALPRDMVFVRGADIGAPAFLVDALRAQGIEARGAVMVVGNGFHEVRGQTDARMVEVFRGYCEAGIVLIFTEESALRIDDLLATAWNTYHAGFRYVHDKSGQGLRPAEPAEPSRFQRALGKSWRECAELAGYVRLDAYSSRSRSVYPLAPRPRANPSISTTHFCVPQSIMRALPRAPRGASVDERSDGT